MATPPLDESLHLPSLSIKGLRGMDELSIPRLGRVTLIAGQNGVGKTTLLDAVRIFAARGSYPVLLDVLERREELVVDVDEDGDKAYRPDLEALFFGRSPSADCDIAIGPAEAPRLRIKGGPALQQGQLFPPNRVAEQKLLPGFETEANESLLCIEFDGANHEIPLRALWAPYRLPRCLPRSLRSGLWHDSSEQMSEVRCVSLGPGLPNNYQLGGFWDSVALTDDDSRAVRSLQIIGGEDVERVAFVGHDKRGPSRRAIVKLKGQDNPVPLKSLGDGAVRLLGVALALANGQGGFLLIDEAENGVHHSIQRDFWKMILKIACENDVQVLATTHGWDCVVGFAQAAAELEDVHGVLVRLERYGEETRAVEYSENNLNAAAKYGIEVR
jgi:predicted ATPase